MEINEITVVVCEARNIISKKEQSKFSVIFGVGKEKYCTTSNEEISGVIVWNEEQTISITQSSSSGNIGNNSFIKKKGFKSQESSSSINDNKANKSSMVYKPLVFTVTSNKSTVFGKVVITLNKLSTIRKKYTAPIVLHGKENNSTSELLLLHQPVLIYEAWITKYHMRDSGTTLITTQNKVMNGSNKDDHLVNDKGGLCHTKKYSSSPLTLLKKLATPFNNNNNTEELDEDGKEEQIKNGCSSYHQLHPANLQIKDLPYGNAAASESSYYENDKFSLGNDNTTTTTTTNNSSTSTNSLNHSNSLAVTNEDDDNNNSSYQHNLDRSFKVSNNNKLNKFENLLNFSARGRNQHKRNLSASNALTLVRAQHLHNTSASAHDRKVENSTKSMIGNVMKNLLAKKNLESDEENDEFVANNKHHQTLPSYINSTTSPYPSPANHRTTEEDEITAPIITGVSPMEAPACVKTKVTIRGSNLGLDLEDILSLYICGLNCTNEVRYLSETKLVTYITPEPTDLLPRKQTNQPENSCTESMGEILLVTKSGGTSRCLIKFRIYYNSPDSQHHAHELSQTTTRYSDNFSLDNPTTNVPKVRHSSNVAKNDMDQFSLDNNCLSSTVRSSSKLNDEKSIITPKNTKNGQVLKNVNLLGKDITCLLKNREFLQPRYPLKNLYSFENYTKENLIEEIGVLRKHIEDLTMENNVMKHYVDTLVFRVMEVCPEHLEKYSARPSVRIHPKKNTL